MSEAKAQMKPTTGLLSCTADTTDPDELVNLILTDKGEIIAKLWPEDGRWDFEQITADAHLMTQSWNAMVTAAARLNVDRVELAKALAEGEGIAGMVEACRDWLAMNRRVVAAGGAEGPLDADLIDNFARTQASVTVRMVRALAAIPKPKDA